MSIDLLGWWDGTFSIGNEWVFPGLVDRYGHPADQGMGGPGADYIGQLYVEWQGDFEQFADSLPLSPFCGFLYTPENSSSFGANTPVSGFVNQEGFISFASYGDKKPPPPHVVQVTTYWNFEAFIRNQGGFHIMSGEWLMTSWQNHSISYKFGNLNVKHKISFKERAAEVLSSRVPRLRLP